MRTKNNGFKCVSCGSKDSERYLLGLCGHCRNIILDDFRKTQDLWCSEKSAEYEQQKYELLQAQEELENAELGIELIELLKRIL